jgi:cytosine/adenosine deaminase-related metal-dependent hydrolase
MSLFRTLGEDVPDRLRKYIFPLEENIVDEKLVRVGAKLSMAEMILGGVTTFVDMYYYEDEVAKVTKEMGMRAILGESVLNKKTPDSHKPYGGIDYSINFIEKWKKDDLIIPAIGPHATYTNDGEHLLKIKDIAHKYDVPILMHLSEMDFEIERFKNEYGKTPIEYLDSIGFLCEKLIGAHCVYTTDNDMEILKKNRVSVIHNVGANAKSARPIAPIHRMLKKDISVGIGTDGPMSGNHQDIISVMHQYTKFQKVREGDRSIASALSAVELGTIRGAKAIGLDKIIGSIEVGKRADIIIIDTNTPNMLPLYDYYAGIVYGAYASNVTMTMVNGKVLMKDRKLLTTELSHIYDEVSQMKDIILNMIKS